MIKTPNPQQAKIIWNRWMEQLRQHRIAPINCYNYRGRLGKNSPISCPDGPMSNGRYLFDPQ